MVERHRVHDAGRNVRARLEYDRGEKFENYKSIPSLAEYVLVHQNQRKLEVFSRSDGWVMRGAGPGQTIAVHAIGTELSVDEVYAE
jgi:Uma2 family endonuclease